MRVLVCEWADKESVHTNYAWICTILAKCIVLRRERKWRLDMAGIYRRKGLKE